MPGALEPEPESIQWSSTDENVIRRCELLAYVQSHLLYTQTNFGLQEN